MNRPTISEVGRALYGERWRLPLSEALGVNERTIRRWADGSEPPEAVWGDLHILCLSQAQKLHQIAQKLR